MLFSLFWRRKLCSNRNYWFFNKKIAKFYCSQTPITNNSFSLRATHRKRTNEVSHNFDRRICCSIYSVSEINSTHGENNKIMSCCQADFWFIFNASHISKHEYIDMMLSKHWVNLTLVFTIANFACTIDKDWTKNTRPIKISSVKLRIYKNKKKCKEFE